MSFRTCRKARGSVILRVRDLGVGAVPAAAGGVDVGGAVEAVVVAVSDGTGFTQGNVKAITTCPRLYCTPNRLIDTALKSHS